MNVRLSLLLLTGCAVLGFFMNREQQRGTFEPFDREHRRFLADNQETTGAKAPKRGDPAVTFLRFDDIDLPEAQRGFTAWPPAAGEWQSMLQTLAEFKPKSAAIEFPLVFDPPSAGLADAVGKVPGLALTAIAAEQPGGEVTSFPPGLPELPDVRGNRQRIPEFTALAAPPGINAPLGIADIDLGRHITVDGEWCRVPLLMRNGTKVVPSLILRAIMTWEQVQPEDLTVHLGFAIRCGERLTIPVEEDGSFRLYLPLAPPVPAFDGSMLLFTREDLDQKGMGREIMPLLHALDKRIAWLGADDLAARKRHHLPDGTPVSRAGLAVRAIAAIQSGQFTHPLEQRAQYAMQACAFIFALWMVHWRRRHLWKGLFFGGIILTVISLLSFQTNQTWVPLVTPFSMIAAAFVFGLLVPRREEA